MDDKTLIERMQKNDPAAIEAFYATYYSVFLRVAIRMCGDFHAAQDCAHDAVIKVIDSVGSYAPAKGSPKGWFLTVLGNTVRDWARRMKVRWASSLSGEDSSDDGPKAAEVPGREPAPHERGEAAEKIAAVQAAMMMLDGEQRTLIVLRDYEGLSAPDAGAVLGISAGMVGGRLFRARGRLRTILETNWPDLFGSGGR